MPSIIDIQSSDGWNPKLATETKLKPEFLIADETELRSHFAPTHALALQKSIKHIDKHVRDFIQRSPFVCIGTQSGNGSADVSPRGDPRGFVKVLDDKTLLIPDRPGNNRLDTLSNILSNPKVGLLFLVPGYDETMRINGEAKLTRDPELLALMTVAGRTPGMAIAVEVKEVFIHCAKALRRSRLWDPNEHQNRDEFPSLMKIILDQSDAAPNDPAEMEKLDRTLEEAYQKSMY